MKTGILERLQRGVTLLDGGMGTALIARGLEEGTSPERWNLERPEVVRAVHDGYLAAGSEVVQTNTFGGSTLALASRGLDAQMEAINRAGARIARDAVARCPSQCWVAGNIGPSGRFLPPVGDADPCELVEVFAAQAAALEAGGVDYIAIETMPHLEEALCALRGALSATSLPVSVCLTFERKKRGFFTLMGDRIEHAPRVLADHGAAAVGANCSLGSDVMREACVALVKASPVPVVVQPNAGLPEMVGGRPLYRQSPVDFAKDVAAMAREGAAAVGGCCGTDTRFIAALKELLAQLAEDIGKR